VKNHPRHAPGAGTSGATNDSTSQEAAPTPSAARRPAAAHWSVYLLPASHVPFTWQADGASDDAP